MAILAILFNFPQFVRSHLAARGSALSNAPEGPSAAKESHMRSFRRRLLLAAVILGPACASSTEVEDFAAAASEDSDAATPGADASCSDPSKVDDDEQSPRYEPCVGHNDGSRGSCSAGEICGSMPNVGYTYCMPALPCPTGMVSVINLACAYPCEGASACTEHGLARCAENTLAEFTGESFGWCTP